MEMVVSFILSVAAGVVSYYICKWLEEQFKAGCGAEDYLILQLRLRKGLDLAAYKARYGKEFSTAQLAFVKNCVKSGYATFDGSTLALTPAGLIVQNSILAELL